jgi:RecA-family ATPase
LLEGDTPKGQDSQKAKESMFGWLLASGLPIRAIYDSGGKSLHAIIEIGADGAEQFKERVEKVYQFAATFPCLDKGRKASAQLSRLPGAFRNGECQSLLAWEAGANSYEEWEQAQTEVGQAVKGILESIVSFDKLKTVVVPEKRKLIGDWCKEGDIGYIYAPRGVGKTWLGLDMANSIASGQKFGPWDTHGSIPVLYIDGEVAAGDVQGRAKALGLEASLVHYLNHELLYERFQGTIDLSDSVWQEAILEACDRLAIKAVFLDNLSCLSPAVDENDGVSWSNQLLRWVLAMRRRGVAVVFIHHAGRNGKMRGHSRREDPANWIIQLAEVEQEGERAGAKFIVKFEKNRNAAIWPGDYEFYYEPMGEQTQLTFRLRGKEELLLEILRRKEKVSQAEMAEELGVHRATINRLLDKLEALEWIEHDGKRWKVLK